MSHETFPESSGTSGSEDTQQTRVVRAEDGEEERQIVEWFLEAKRLGYDFAYHQAQPPQTERKILFVAKGFDSASILRVLLDEEKPSHT